jgi:redox-sensitive bicupin YhaK (pirin superfamily)
MFSPVVGAEIHFRAQQPLVLPVNRDFEHALLVLQGDASLNRRPLAGRSLHYLGAERDELHLTGSLDTRVLLIGGEPFKEPVVMWWNFVGSTREEIAAAREDWIEHRRFGEVKAYRGQRLPAPDLARLAPANPAS